MKPRILARLTLVLLTAAAAPCLAAAPYQDQGVILKDFDGRPYEAVLTGSNGATARFGLKQISPYQMLVSRGKVLVVYGTKRDAQFNEAKAREEAARWHVPIDSSPNWPPSEVRLASDAQVKDTDLAGQDVVLVGSSESNAVTARVIDKLPVKVTGTSVDFGECGILGSVTAGRFMCPNSFNKSHFMVVVFGGLEVDARDVRWSAAYRWNAALTYFWHMTDYSFITKDGTIRGGYFAKQTRTEWIFDPKLMVTVPNVFSDPYKDWKERQTVHFTFHYAPNSAAAERISSMETAWDSDWEDVYSEVSKALGITYDRRIHVYMFTDWDEADRYAAVGFSPIKSGDRKAAGLTDAKNGVIMLMGMDNAAPGATSRHEVAHILAEKLAPPTVTLNAEGLACSVEGERPSQAAGKTLKEWECSYLSTHGCFPPLSVLLKPQGFSAYPVREAYPLASSFTRFLVDHYGLLKYKEYYKTSAFSDAEAALQRIFEKTAAEIEKEWYEAVRVGTVSIRKAQELEQQANEAYCKREFSEACEKATTAAALNPNLTLAYFLIGACHNRMKQSDCDAAISALHRYQAALQSLGQPEQPWTYIEIGYAHDLKGERQKAVFCYNKAVLLPDDRGSKSEAQRRLTEPFRKDGR